MLTLRGELTAHDPQAREGPGRAATSTEDAWRRRTEMLFERLAVRWVIAGLPLDDQKMLLGRYRMADSETQAWVRRTIAKPPRAAHPRARRMSGPAPLTAAWVSDSGGADRRRLRARARRPSSPSRRRRATSRPRRRSAPWSPRCCPTRRRSSGRPARRPGTRPTCSRRSRAPASGRVLLLGHLDTVVAHDDHRPLERDGDRLIGSGAVDMKGGIALALGVMRALAAIPESFAELAAAHRRRRGVAHRRLRPRAALRRLRRLPLLRGRPARRGRRGGAGRQAQGGRDAPRPRARGRRPLGLVAGEGPQRAARARRGGRAWWPRAPTRRATDRLTAVPTVLRAGDAFNVVPAEGELVCDLRAERLEALEAVRRGRPGGDRRRRPRGRAGAPLAGDGLARRRRRAPARPGRRAARQPPAGRRARRRQRREPHGRPRSSSPSTGSGRAAATPITRTSSSPSPRCARARRSRWRSPRRRSGPPRPRANLTTPSVIIARRWTRATSPPARPSCAPSTASARSGSTTASAR